MNTESRSFRTFGIRHSTLVILLTILAGVLRFSSLDKPSIWGDEAATWRRASGSYQQLLDELRTAGFMPANYLLTWWIKDGFPVWGHYERAERTTLPDMETRFFRRFGEAKDPAFSPRMVWTPTVRLVPGGITPTPLVMRFIPALCGTLMVPAMYFLASRLVSRRTALLVALFTCCSAYLLNYSRDAKMYMQLWFFATLNVGCLLWWLEAYKRQPGGPVPLSPMRPWSPMQQELGEGVAGVLPADHVGHVARAFVVDADIRPAAMVQRRVPRLETFLRFTCWLTAGFAMIAFHAVGLAVVGIELLIVLATIPQRAAWVGDALGRLRGKFTASLFEEPEVARPSLVSRLHIPPLISFLVGAYCIIALFNSYKSFTRFYARVEPASTQRVQYDIDDMGIGWVEEYNDGRTAGGHFLENATAFLMSWEWPKDERDVARINPEALKRLQLAAVVLLTAIGVGLVPWKSVLDRWTSAPRDRGPMPATSLLIVAAWLLVPLYGVYAASGAWDDAASKEPARSPIATIASAFFPAATPGHVDALRGKLAPYLKSAASGETAWSDAIGQIFKLPWSELFVVHGLGNAPVRWWAVEVLFLALLVGAVGWRRPGLLRYDDEVSPSRSLRRRRAVAWWGSLAVQFVVFSIAIVALVLILLVTFVVVPPQQMSVWMPRYVGFVWPAFAIAICVLIRRLPLLPLRWAVIAFLLATNLVVFTNRVRNSEPPTADIARDQIAVKDGRTARVFNAIIARGQFGGPGAGGVYSVPAIYYYVTMSGLKTTPREVFNYLDRNELGARIGPNYPNILRATLRRDTTLTDVYVWAQVPFAWDAGKFEKQLQAATTPGWEPAEPMKRWPVYDHWTWQQICVMERHHWKRAATTQPTTRPTTTAAVIQRRP